MAEALLQLAKDVAQGKVDRKAYDLATEGLELGRRGDIIAATSRKIPGGPKIGAGLVKVVQACVAALQEPTSSANEELAIMTCNAIQELYILQPTLSLKQPLTLESLAQRAVGTLVEVSQFQSALTILSATVEALHERGFLLQQNLNWTLEEKSCSKDPALQGKLVCLIVFCLYNTIRCTIEIGDMETALTLSGINLDRWLALLNTVDKKKTNAYAESVMALLYHHGPAKLESESRFEEAFCMRLSACSSTLQQCIGTSNKENGTQSISEELVRKVMGAAVKLIKSGSSGNGDVVVSSYAKCLETKNPWKPKELLVIGASRAALFEHLVILELDRKSFQASVGHLKAEMNNIATEADVVLPFLELLAILISIQWSQGVNARLGCPSCGPRTLQKAFQKFLPPIQTNQADMEVTPQKGDSRSSQKNVLSRRTSRNVEEGAHSSTRKENMRSLPGARQSTEHENESEERIEKHFLVQLSCNFKERFAKSSQLGPKSMADRIKRLLEKLCKVLITSCSTSNLPDSELMLLAAVLAPLAESMLIHTEGEPSILAATAFRSLAEVYLQLEQKLAAVNAISLAEKSSRGSPQLEASIYNAAYNFGAKLYNAGDYTTAESFLRIASSSNSSRARVLATCLVRQSKYLEAREVYEQLILDTLCGGESHADLMGQIVTGFSRSNFEICKAELGPIQCVLDCIEPSTFFERLLNGSGATIVFLAKLESDAYNRLMCSEQSSRDVLYELQDFGLAKARELLSGNEKLGCRDQLDIHTARLLWLRFVHSSFCPECQAAEVRNGDASLKLGPSMIAANEVATHAFLERAESLCMGAIRDHKDNSVPDLNLAEGLLWSGVVRYSLNRGGREGVAKAIGMFCTLLEYEGDASRAIEALSFANEWCEYVGWIREGSTAGAGLLASAGAVDLVGLVRLALEKDMKLGSPQLARFVLNNRLEVEGTDVNAILAAAKAHQEYESGEEDCDAGILYARDQLLQAHREAENAEEASMYEILAADLAFARGRDSTSALEETLAALKHRVGLSPSYDGPFPRETGIAWRHVSRLAECMALTGRILERRGDPRSALYYYNQGNALAAKVGSTDLMLMFAVLSSNLQVKCGRSGDASHLGRFEAQDPEDLSYSEAQAAKAQVLALSGDRKLALVAYNEALSRLTSLSEKRVEIQFEPVELRVLMLLGWVAPEECALDMHDENDGANSQIISAVIQRAMYGISLGKARALVSSYATAAENEEGVAVLKELVECTSRTGSAEYAILQAEAALELGIIELGRENWEPALHYLNISLAACSHFDVPDLKRRGLRAAARCKLELDTGKGSGVLPSIMIDSSFALALELDRERQKGEMSSLLPIPLHFPECTLAEIDEYQESIGKLLPRDWIVCGISPSERSGELLLTRKTQSSSTVVVMTLDSSVDSWILRLGDIIERAESTTKGLTTDTAALLAKSAKREWWAKRKALDAELENFLLELDDEWFQPFRFVFSTHTAISSEQQDAALDCFEQLVLATDGGPNIRQDVWQAFVSFWCTSKSRPDLEEALQRVFGVRDGDRCSELVESILAITSGSREGDSATVAQHDVSKTGSPSKMKVAELKLCLSRAKLPTSGLKKDLIARLKAHEASVGHSAEEISSKGHLVLVLSEHMHQMPFESVPSLRGRSVSRVPSLRFLLQLLAEERRLSATSGSYMVDPRGDLAGTQQSLAPALERLESAYGWEGAKGRAPIEHQQAFFGESLESRDVVLYCGHGSGEDLISREKVAKLQHCAAALLMGCSSGRVRRQGLFEPSGVVFSYIVAGSQAVVANLWDVTDKDIDLFTMSMLDKWIFDEEEDHTCSLATALDSSRSVCRLPSLVGAAPVLIGLPVKLN